MMKVMTIFLVTTRTSPRGRAEQDRHARKMGARMRSQGQVNRHRIGCMIDASPGRGFFRATNCNPLRASRRVRGRIGAGPGEAVRALPPAGAGMGDNRYCVGDCRA
ncbi:MAG TPA: hypothetical protein VMM15_08995 [Bradyrhizobium sp.]|nr:hypothetical protein [Bradyrhizobium sp.]